MANDRMFLKNKITGKDLCIAKHYCNGWYICNPHQLVEQLTNLFEGFDPYDPQPFNDDDSFYKYHQLYEITYENDTDKDHNCCGCGAPQKEPKGNK